MTGKIIKAIAGFYYVHTEEGRLYACRARGLFRKDGIKPLVGDNVRIEVLAETAEGGEGSVVEILPRRNLLLRPAVANVDQALVVFAVREPDPNLNLLDRFLISMERQQIPAIICFNKADLDRDGLLAHDEEVYRKAGYEVISCCTFSPDVMAQINRLLAGRTTVLAGPSGVGKSSLTNLIHGEQRMEVGALSEKIKRGKQTTRHTELFSLEPSGTYLLDTPGFTSLTLPGLSAEAVKAYFPEFDKAAGNCRFSGCVHVREPERCCGVKQAVAAGRIFRERYENYLQIYEEQKELERR